MMLHNKQRNPLTDALSTLSLVLSWSALAPGNSYHVIVPLETLTLDGRGDEAALFSVIDDLKLFAPAGVRCLLLASDVEPPGGNKAQLAPNVDPTQDVRYSLQFELHIPAGAGAAANKLLAVFGHTLATATPEPVSFPVIAPNASPLTVTTAGGTPVACKVITL